MSLSSCGKKWIPATGESGLRLQFVTNEPKAFGDLMAHYGRFSRMKNYIALIGLDRPNTPEKVGYYGARLDLTAQCLRLNTCWMALTFSKGKIKKFCNLASGESWSMCWLWGAARPRAWPTSARSCPLFAPASLKYPMVPIQHGVCPADPTAMNQ